MYRDEIVEAAIITIYCSVWLLLMANGGKLMSIAIIMS